jgi:hypothetical protein
MVLGGIDSIGTDDVGTQLLQVGNVTLAAVNIGQRIGVVGVLGSCAVGLVLLLVGNTANEEFCSVVEVEELVALYQVHMS